MRRKTLALLLLAGGLAAAPAVTAQTTDYIYINLNDGRYIQVELDNFADVSLAPNGGNKVEFATAPTHSAVELVDLGLPSGTKWASCNLGAKNPWDSGDYYQWGEIAAPADGNYTTLSCSAYDMNKATLQSEGYIDASGNLTPDHDAAAVKLGGGALIPTDVH